MIQFWSDNAKILCGSFILGKRRSLKVWFENSKIYFFEASYLIFDASNF